MTEKNLRQALDNKIAILEKKKQAIDSLLVQLEGMRDTIADLPTDIAAILEGDTESDEPESTEAQGFLQRDIQPAVPDAEAIPPKEDDARQSNLKGPTAAVLDFLKKHPGTTSGKLVLSLQGRINTTSDDPKTIIYVTVSYLKKNKRIKEGPAGGLFLNE